MALLCSLTPLSTFHDPVARSCWRRSFVNMNSPYFILAHLAPEVHRIPLSPMALQNLFCLLFASPFFQHTCNNSQPHNWFKSKSLTGILQVSFVMPLPASGWELCKDKKCLILCLWNITLVLSTWEEWFISPVYIFLILRHVFSLGMYFIVWFEIVM